MKYLSLVLAACLALTIPAFANTPEPSVSVNAVAEKAIEVTITNLQQSRATVTIKNLNGSVEYFRDVVKNHNGYRKRLNFKDLENGKYLLVIEQGNERFIQVIVLKDNPGMLLSGITKN